MTWRTIVVPATSLAEECAHIRREGGTIIKCDRCSSGYRLVCTFPG